jgi:hypothetical protein
MEGFSIIVNGPEGTVGVLKGHPVPLSLQGWISQKDVRKFLLNYSSGLCDRKITLHVHTRKLKKWNKLCQLAAYFGHFKLLKWLRSTQPYTKWGKKVCAQAAGGGHLDILKWLRSQGAPWNKRTCEYAAEGGHIHILKWVRFGQDENPEGPCPLSRWVCAYAAGEGHLNLLQWLRFPTSGLSAPWDEHTSAFAAESGHLEVLKWARENGAPLGVFTCALAARGGHLDILKWLRSPSTSDGSIVPWNEMVCAYAAESGHLEILKWARAQEPPAPWDTQVCMGAARNGHLEILKWSRSQEPPASWGAQFWRNVMIGDPNHDLGIAKWAAENGYPNIPLEFYEANSSLVDHTSNDSYDACDGSFSCSDDGSFSCGK